MGLGLGLVLGVFVRGDFVVLSFYPSVFSSHSFTFSFLTFRYVFVMTMSEGKVTNMHVDKFRLVRNVVLKQKKRKT